MGDPPGSACPDGEQSIRYGVLPVRTVRRLAAGADGTLTVPGLAGDRRRCHRAAMRRPPYAGEPARRMVTHTRRRTVDRASKEELVAELRQSFTSAGVVVVTHYRGLTVAESTQLRIGMREVGASFKVTKNTLARLALQGTAFEGIIPLFNGPTAIAVSSDP